MEHLTFNLNEEQALMIFMNLEEKYLSRFFYLFFKLFNQVCKNLTETLYDFKKDIMAVLLLVYMW